MLRNGRRNYDNLKSRLADPRLLFSKEEIKDILAHDMTCSSLTWLWFPFEGGRTALSDLYECEGCGLEFLAGGLYTFECEYSPHSYCQCCERRAWAMCRCAEGAGDIW